MPINVICPGCLKRFAVSDQFAGKTGPCPSCKAPIKVPEKAQEVVVHAPEVSGPKDSKGRSVLKPIRRSELKLSVPAIVAIVSSVIAVLLIAVMLRFIAGGVSGWILAIGAILLGPPLAMAGYSFLRDDELEPYRGRALYGRIGICGLVYALLWGIYAGIPWLMPYLPFDNLLVVALMFLGLIGVGGFTAYAALDFDFGIAAIHYGMYLVVTVVLSFIVGVNAFTVQPKTTPRARTTPAATPSQSTPGNPEPANSEPVQAAPSPSTEGAATDKGAPSRAAPKKQEPVGAPKRRR